MQIHELNTYDGSLNSGAYLAVDNGADTGKVSVANLLAGVENEIEQLDADLNGRIDNIIAGGDAPSAAEIVDARQGAAVLGSKNYASLGASIRGQATEIYNVVSEIENDVYSSELVRHYDPTIGYDGHINLCSGNDGIYLIPTLLKKGFIDLYSYKPNETAYRAYVLDKNYIVKKIVNCFTAVTAQIFLDQEGYIAIGGDGYYLAWYKSGYEGDTTYENVQYRVSTPAGSENVIIGDDLSNWVAIGQKGAYLVNITQHETYFDSTEPEVITVGTGKDYTDLKQAIEYANTISGESIVEVYEGTYNVFANITQAEINDASYTGDASHFVGLKITEGMTLRGIGDKSKIIINGELPESVSQSARNAISTLNLIGNCTIENVTVKGTNIRYPVHDDYSAGLNAIHNVKNCIFHAVSGPYGSIPHAYGLGTRSGMKVYFEECEFFPSMVYHTNQSFAFPSVVKLNNCTVDGYIELNDYDPSVISQAIIENTSCASIQYKAQAGVSAQGIEVIVRGAHIPIINLTSYGVLYDTSDTLKGRAFDNLTKGYPARVRDNYQIQVFYSDTNPALCEGVVLKDVSYRDVAIIQCHGWIETSFFPTLTLAVGDKIGVVNGAFAIVQSNEIGIVKRAGLVWLY